MQARRCDDKDNVDHHHDDDHHDSRRPPPLHDDDDHHHDHVYYRMPIPTRGEAKTHAIYGSLMQRNRIEFGEFKYQLYQTNSIQYNMLHNSILHILYTTKIKLESTSMVDNQTYQ
jgi:hypothetical protein